MLGRLTGIPTQLDYRMGFPCDIGGIANVGSSKRVVATEQIARHVLVLVEKESAATDASSSSKMVTKISFKSCEHRRDPSDTQVIRQVIIKLCGIPQSNRLKYHLYHFIFILRKYKCSTKP